MYYNHITINERACIYVFLKNGMSIREIAKALGRNPSTISREIKRNSHRVNHLYHPEAAQKKYDGRRLICHRKKNNNIIILLKIKEKIQKHWSPEQIYGRAKEENEEMPSTSTIYRMIHDKRINNITMEKLRRKGHFKRPAETRGKFNVDNFLILIHYQLISEPVLVVGNLRQMLVEKLLENIKLRIVFKIA